MISADLKAGGGKTVELGAGTGNFKAFKPEVIAGDIEEGDWLDIRLDAHMMPFGSGSIANIVMIDVLHHLADPIGFIREAVRVLAPGGRLLLLEPYPSPLSYVVYRLFHREPMIFNIDYFKRTEVQKKDPWLGNQAVAYLLLYKYRKKFLERFGRDILFAKKKRLACLLYPLSGGFEGRTLIPDCLISIFKGLEKLLIPFRFLLAFRCYIVLEKR